MKGNLPHLLRALTCTMLAMVLAHLPRAAGNESPVRPFLEEHCYDCHDEDTQKAGLRLDTLSLQLSEPESFQSLGGNL